MGKQQIIASESQSSDDQVNNEQANNEGKISVGLSACLAGHTVRYNGGHSQSRLCLNKLNEHFHYHTFCPEVSAGFGTPRPTMRLIGNPDNPTLTFSDNDQLDLTKQLQEGFEGYLPTLGHLDGYILMKNSPSCGLERIKVYQENGYPHEQRTRGLFTDQLIKQFPMLPVEEEGRLNDPRLCENFILRVYAHHNFRNEVLEHPSLHNLIAFHSSYKYTVMAHNQTQYKKLGRMLANTNKQSVNELIVEYFEQFMLALSKPANAKNHSNTLLHILGYLKKSVPSAARQNIVDVINQYRQGQLPLITPLTLLKHYVEQTGSEYIRAQRYLQPYPSTLGLANRL